MPTDELTPLYIDGVGPIPWTRFTQTGGTQSLAKSEPAGTDGQIVQPTGKRAKVVQGELMFFRSMDLNLYPNYFRQCKAKSSAREQIAFLDPEDGQLYGHLEQFDAAFAADELNGCRVTFTFQQALTRATVVPRQEFWDAFAEAAAAAQAADAGLDAIGVALPAGAPPLAQQVAALNTATLGDNDLDANELRGNLNTLRGVVRSTQLAPALQSEDNAEIYYALQAVASQATQAVETALAAAQDTVVYNVEYPISPAEICATTYGTDEYVERLVELNPPPAPWYWAPGKLRLPVVPPAPLAYGLPIIPTPIL